VSHAEWLRLTEGRQAAVLLGGKQSWAEIQDHALHKAMHLMRSTLCHISKNYGIDTMSSDESIKLTFHPNMHIKFMSDL